jgi:hypothetical protein
VTFAFHDLRLLRVRRLRSSALTLSPRWWRSRQGHGRERTVSAHLAEVADAWSAASHRARNIDKPLEGRPPAAVGTGSASLGQANLPKTLGFVVTSESERVADDRGSNLPSVLGIYDLPQYRTQAQDCHSISAGRRTHRIDDRVLRRPSDRPNEQRGVGEKPVGCVYRSPPANDDFNNALVVTGLPFSHSVNTSHAPTASDDPSCRGHGMVPVHADRQRSDTGSLRRRRACLG